MLFTIDPGVFAGFGFVVNVSANFSSGIVKMISKFRFHQYYLDIIVVIVLTEARFSGIVKTEVKKKIRQLFWTLYDLFHRNLGTSRISIHFIQVLRVWVQIFRLALQ